MAIHHEAGADEQKERDGKKRHHLYDAVVRHHREVGFESPARHGSELSHHQLAERSLGRHRFHGLDALDGVDLVRVVPAVRIFQLVEQRAQEARGEVHERRIQRRRRQKHEREPRAVDHHHRQRREQLYGGRECTDSLLHEELPDMLHPFESPLDVAGAARREITHRQREQSPREVIERRGVNPHGGETHEVALHQRGRRHEHEHAEHADDEQTEQRPILIHHHAVHDDLREYRQHHLQPADDGGERQRLQHEGQMRAEERPQPPDPGLRDRGLLERLRVVEERRITRPLFEQLGAGDLHMAERGINQPGVRVAHVVQHHPVVAFPVDDRRQRHLFEVARRRLHGARGQSEFGRGQAEPAQTRAVETRVHELPDARQTHGAAVVPAHHRQARGAAVHLVDLVDEREPADTLRLLPEMSAVRLEWFALWRVLAAGGVSVELIGAHRIARTQFGGQRFLSEIERDAGDVLVIVLRNPFLDARPKFGIGPQQSGKRVLPERGERAVRHRLDARRARRILEDRQLAEEVAFPVVGDVPPPTLLLHKHAKAPLLHDVHRARGIPFANHQLARFHGGAVQFGEQLPEGRRRQFRERRELLEKIAQPAV